MGCPFCAIVAGTGPARIVYQDDKVLCFCDRSPSARLHLLVTPRRHIKNLHALSAAEEGLERHMLRVGREAIARESGSSDTSDALFGYHLPPFTSVDHLHLHCISGPWTSWWRALKYSPDTLCGLVWRPARSSLIDDAATAPPSDSRV
mmetsp:Transcript_3327/g.11953  ORF Transcript_3327/g.11953 Transcript_3327/m.11953 type:complete len:148 (-) Transcript_3327:335-778(-)